MPIPMAPTSLVEEGATLQALQPAWAPINTSHEPGCHGSMDEEEPEIVDLLAAHYRNLLALHRLSAQQRAGIGHLLADCEVRLRHGGEHDRSREVLASGPAVGVHHRNSEWLTAVRLYTAGAQRALARGRPEAASHALSRIIDLIDRAEALSGAACRPDAQVRQYTRQPS